MKKQKELVKTVEGIFDLKYSLENVFFRSFSNTFSFESDEKLFHSHIITLVILSYHGTLAMSEVSHKLNLEKGSFTPVAAKLIELEYMTKTQGIEDKRVYNLTLTSQGRKIAEEFKEKHKAFVSQLITQFTQDEKQEYFEAVNKVQAMTKRLEL